MQLEKLHLAIMEKLEKDLPVYLFYHDAEHTKDVLKAAQYLAQSENISDYDLKLLKTAALFHDTGFLESSADHEEISCKIANELLPQFEYNAEEIKKICALIMVTKTPQKPTNKLEEILCDADLYYLGTDNFFVKAEKLYKEMHKTGAIKNYNKWQDYQVQFLQSHHYFTATANHKLNQKKELNLKRLEAKLPAHLNKKRYSEKFAHFGDVILILIGVITAAFALKGFLVPNKFFDGGVTGISLLIHELYHFNLGYVIVLANLPFIVMCVYAINFKYALKTFFCILILGICLLYMPYPIITSDKLLVSIFGGFFLGVGIGLTMRAGCAVDGIEVLALYTWRRTSFTISEIILALNILIFSIAAFRFGMETALYSMLTYFTASKTVDYVVEGIEAYTGVTIISSESEIIKDRLVNELGRGITIYKGERGFLPGKFEVYNDCDIIFTVISRLELRKLKNVVHEVDANAFVFANTVKEATGGVMKRRHVH
ncbi:MAG: YitT family protein [Chitinophagaceae bacterium]